VDFTLSDDQELLRDTARSLFSKECPTSLVRAHADDPSVADGLDKRLREFAGLADAPLADLCLFLEEAGAALAPGRFFPTSALFAPLLRAIEHPLLEDVVAGDVTGTVAIAGRDGVWAPSAEPVKSYVPEGDRVDHVAVVHAGDAGPSVMVLSRPQVRPLPTVDTSRRLCELDLDAIDVGAATVDGPHPLSPAAVAAVMERAAVAVAAELLGASRWMFEATLAYAKQREQFDRPIGSFQAIKHKLANMALTHERASSALYYAAMAIDANDPDRHRAAHVAKAAAGEAARLSARDGIQIHGGIGYTWDHDLHLFIRRAYASEYLLGDTAWHHDQLAALLLD
jgi:alkylation response protein AidB-like acyl-CoA dehydrogenase